MAVAGQTLGLMLCKVLQGAKRAGLGLAGHPPWPGKTHQGFHPGLSVPALPQFIWAFSRKG